MKTILLALLVGMVLFSGCIGEPRPKFDLEVSDTPKLDFNPLSFQVLKLWNENNLTTQSIQLDSCNTATRMLDQGMTTWRITLDRC